MVCNCYTKAVFLRSLAPFCPLFVLFGMLAFPLFCAVCTFLRLTAFRALTSGNLGACAMTTKLLDNKICTFEFLLSWRFPRKKAFLDKIPLCPQFPPPPLKSANSIFIVVSPSLRISEILDSIFATKQFQSVIFGDSVPNSHFEQSEAIFQSACLAAKLPT